MKPWKVWNWKFPDAGEHRAVILGAEDRVRLKPRAPPEQGEHHRETGRPGLDAAPARRLGAVDPGRLKPLAREPSPIPANHFPPVSAARKARRASRHEAILTQRSSKARSSRGRRRLWATCS